MVTLRKPDPLRLLLKRLLIVFLAAVVLLAAWGVWGIYGKNAEAARLRHEAQAHLSDLMEREQKLESDYDKLTSSRGMEAVLRDSYAVGRDGENLVVIVEPQTQHASAASSSPWDWIQRVFPW